MIPTSIFGMWLRSFLAIAIIASGIYLVHDWYEENSPVIERSVPQSDIDTKALRNSQNRTLGLGLGFNERSLELAVGVFLLLISLFGGHLLRAVDLLILKKGSDDPKALRTGAVTWLNRPDGSTIRMETYGDATKQAILFSHGWGANSEEWYYAKKYLSSHYQIIVWDEPGLGMSKKPGNNDYSMEKLASDLNAVISASGAGSIILVGHSIGGMITLKFCQLFPDILGQKIKGLILAHTTYINPVRTTKYAGLCTALEKPLLVPLLYLTIAIWPLAWLMNWLSYLNGSAHRSTRRSSFAGTQTRGQLDFITRFTPHARPDILCYGMLGMLKYDVTSLLPSLSLPILVIDGDKDPVTVPEASVTIQSNVRRGVLSTLMPAKHMGLIEHYERFNTLVSDFAELLSGGTETALGQKRVEA